MRPRIGIGLSAALCAWLLLGPLTSQLEVNADSERDLFRAAGLVDQGKWPAGGPAVDYLPITLGPGWYLATAPALAFSRSPYAAHVMHVLWVLAGLIFISVALHRAVGAEAALVLALLLATSQWLTQVMVRVWHNAMLPGCALVFLGLLWAGQGLSQARHRAWVLTGAWGLLVLMLQLHLLSVAYGAVLLGVWISALRRDGIKSNPIANGLSLVVLLALVAGYGGLLLGMDWESARQLRAQRMGDGAGLTEILLAVPQYLRSGWSGPQTAALGWLILAFAGLGLWRVCREARTGWGWLQWVAVQAFLGLGCAWLLGGLSMAPRYFNAAIPATYLLAAVGIQTAFDRLPASRRAAVLSGTVTITLVASLWGGWGGWPVNEDGTDRTHAQPSFSEQAALVEALDEAELSWRDLDRRAHGPLFGPLTAFRYLAWTRGLPQREISGLPMNTELFLAPEGFPEPAGTMDRKIIDGGSFRPLVLARFKPRFASEAVTLAINNQRCPIRLPYRWSHLTRAELKPFNIIPGFDLRNCIGKHTSAALKVALPALGPEPVHVVCEWYDLASRYHERATLKAISGATVQRVEGDMVQGMAVWKVTPTGGPLRLELEPLNTLATLDIY